MAEPVILITGSTDGIGKSTAFALAGAGAFVILHGRDEKKGGRVMRLLEKEIGNEQADLVIADYSEQEQIRHMASDLLSRYTCLDVLVNNAGTFQKIRRITREGIELTFAVNYLGPFLLTHLIQPLFRSGSRIVTVASSAHEDVDRIDWENLPLQPRYDAWSSYALSKFADVTFTYTLARNLEGTGITANCLHPGVVNTKLSRSASPGAATLTPEEGAQTSIWLASSPDVAGVSGRYFEEKQAVRSSSLTYDIGVQKRLRKVAQELTGVTGSPSVLPPR